MAKAPAIDTVKDASKKGTVYLESAANSDNGWGLTKSSPSTVMTTALALQALVSVESRTKGIITKAQNRLFNWQDNSSGYWQQDDEENRIYLTGLVLETLVLTGIDFSDMRMQQASTFLLEHQNEDGGWGGLLVFKVKSNRQ